MRSRCRGSMLAWILKTKPENAAVVRRRPARPRLRRGAAGRECSRKPSSSSCTPKLLTALPKKTGVSLPGQHRRAGRTPRPRRRASPASSQHGRGRSPRRAARARPGRARPARRHRRAVGAARRCARRGGPCRVGRSQTPLKVDARAQRPVHRDRRAMPSTLSSSSSSSSGSRVGPVQLVHEGEDRHAALAADLEELARLALDALAGVDDHDRRVDGRQHAVGVLGEILVAGRVEQVDAVAAVVELQHGGADRRCRACFSSSIQSEVVARWFLRAVTEPASCTAPP